MRNPIRRTTLSLSLSALVLVWGIVPPGIQHAHAGGNRSHRHDHGHEAAHHGSHDHDSAGEHHQHATRPDLSFVADYVRHIHCRFLGVEFSMPAPAEPADDSDDERSVPRAFVRTMNEGVPLTQTGPSFGRVFLGAICAPSGDVVRNPKVIPRPPNVVTSTPLCDAARLERSGVLLA